MKDHILVISENRNHEIILRKKLDGLSLIFLSTRQFAEEKLAHLRFSFVIIDESDGHDTLTIVKAIKGNINTRATPILVILSKLNKTYLEKLVRNGVANFISMPIADENIFQTLHETAEGKKSEDVISSFTMPIIESPDKDLSNHNVIDREMIYKVREALTSNASVCLALISTENRPEGLGDLLIQVKENLFCVISLSKNKKQMVDDILCLKKQNLYAGIVTTDDAKYSDIAMMIKDGQKALERARQTPHGISFHTKT